MPLKASQKPLETDVTWIFWESSGRGLLPGRIFSQESHTHWGKKSWSHTGGEAWEMGVCVRVRIGAPRNSGVLVTFVSVVTKITNKATSGRKGIFRFIFEGAQSMMAGKHGCRKVRWPDTSIHGQEAETDGGWRSAHFLLFIESRSSAHGMMPTILKECLPSVNLSRKHSHRYNHS